MQCANDHQQMKYTGDQAHKWLCNEIVLRHPPKGAETAALSSRPVDGEFSSENGLVPDVSRRCAHAAQMVQRCDLIYRTDAPLWPHSGGPEDAPVARTSFFDEARACFRPQGHQFRWDGGDPASPHFSTDFAVFAQAVCGYHVPNDAYGVAGGVARMQVDMASSYNEAEQMTKELVSAVANSGNLDSLSTHFIAASNAVRSYLKSLRRDDAELYLRKVKARSLLLESANLSYGIILGRVQAHMLRRAKRQPHLLGELADDVVAVVMQHVPAAAAAALMQTCKLFAKMPLVKARLPHLHIRQVVGVFPHHRVISRDRKDLARGTSKSVMRNFVVACNAVRLYVDLVQPERRAAPLKRLPSKEGISEVSTGAWLRPLLRAHAARRPL